MKIRNEKNGEIFENIRITQPYKIYSTSANESEVETVFEEYLKFLGYQIGENYTKRSAKNANDTFVSKTGNGIGFPDYVFYENNTDRIIAIGDVKRPDVNGTDTSINGLNDCTDVYLKYYNERHKNKIKIAFGYDGINFIIKYLSSDDEWADILIDEQPINAMPIPPLLLSVSKNGNMFTTQIDRNVDKEKLEPYFARCDSVFRTSKNGLSAIDKATEISTLIFLKIFSNDGSDDEFTKQYGESVWESIKKGKVDFVNKLFGDFLNKHYQNIFPDKLIKVDSQVVAELALIIDLMFNDCKIDRMTDVKGNALEYYQKASKDRKIGEFFTPRHLIRLMMEMTDPEITFEKDDNGDYLVYSFGNRKIDKIEKIYDPACGSGGFLIQSFIYYLEKYEKYGVSKTDLKEDVLFGNELKDSTVMLTKLNMILLGDGHNHISNENSLSYTKTKKLQKIIIDDKPVMIDSSKVVFKEEVCGTNTVTLPFYEDKPLLEVINAKKQTKTYFLAEQITKRDKVTPVYEFSNIEAVNPKVKMNLKPYFGKFDIVMTNHPYGLEEPTTPDAWFLKHMFESISKNGRIACIVGETLLFHKDYKKIREFIIDNYTVEAIISLPQGVFNPYTDVKTSILFMKKEKNKYNKKTWLVDLHNDGYDLNSTRNQIKENDIPKTIQLWERWGGYLTVNNEYKSFHKEEKGFAEFHQLASDNWCVKRYMTPLISLNSEYELKPLSKLLKRVKNTVNIKDDVIYKQITIQMWNKGIVLRENQYGMDIGTKKQFLVKKNQFLISKIDARNGAYGIVPRELDNAIITGNFWAFEINTDEILPEYITYLMRHNFFTHMCEICSYGSTNRWYLDENAFNNFLVPIPKIDEQREILARITLHAQKIKDAKKVIEQQEQNIMSVIDDVLGL